MNLALLRVCAAVMIMNALYNIASLFFNMSTTDDGSSGFYVSLVFVYAILLIFGIVALVKKNIRILKVYAVWIAICILIGSIMDVMNFNRVYLPLGVGYGRLFNSLLERIVNPMIVFVVAVFFIEPKKATSFGLFQFCAAFFLVDGANDMIQSIVSLFKGAESFSIVNAVLALLPIALGVFAMVKRNSLILKIYAVIAFVELLWGSLGYMRENMYGGYYVASAFVGLMFNTFLVVCVATFFIEPEKTRDYFQKVKSLFVKWKEMT
ncbi:hypothetical protein [Fibrobacter sp.]|jgi:hypothetical protein|uniref:hypothetical protein n=1 Tax=Fibrobacter sp. TaxID=35828 RepID=UPI00386CE29D